MATMLEPVSLIALLVVLAAGGIAAFTDRRDFKVPNLLTLPLLSRSEEKLRLPDGGLWPGFPE
jgi:hypothetical protein